MVFPADPRHVPRHPSQLYEAFAEGIVLSVVLWSIDRWAYGSGWYRRGLTTGVFLIGYAIIRFSLEFTREPDAQLGLVLGPFSMGQLLSLMMLACGIAVLGVVYRNHGSSSTAEPPLPPVR
jgi:phosphatidylglycerol:prolipoprotein diacylglycerol transferase